MIDGRGSMHEWFSLSYANYLVLPRSLIQEMPIGWQRRMVKLLEELSQTFDFSMATGGLANFVVQVRGKGGKFVADPLAPYRHPNAPLIAAMRRG